MWLRNLRHVIDFAIALLILIYLALGIYVFGDSIYGNYYDLLKKNLGAFVLLTTSIVAGAYVFIRIYIENQIKIREEIMIREYEIHFNNKIAEQTKEMNNKFAEQTKEMNNKIAEQTKGIDTLNQKFDEQSMRLNAAIEILRQLWKPPPETDDISEPE